MSEAPDITAGYAHHRDFHGAAFTLQDIKLDTAPDMLARMELMCIDQTPEDDHGKELRKVWAGFAGAGVWGAQYHPFTERVGTSDSRDMIFAKAHGRIVVVMDCHVLFPAAVATRWQQILIDYFADPAHARDIVSGPILDDSIRQRSPNSHKWAVMATHYADHWRAEMWGTWAGTFMCPCGGWRFSTWSEGSLVRYEDVTINPKFHKACPACNKRLPLLDWGGHDQMLMHHGYVSVGAEGGDPFEISGQGLGFFAMLRENWPGMPEGLWGFGGEELCLHSLVRAKGGRAVCIPELLWWHRFPRPDGSTYPNTHWYKCRNYVIWFNHLRELTGDTERWSLEHVRRHFVDDMGVAPKEEWDVLAADPQGHIHGPTDKHVQPTIVDGRVTAYYKRTIEEAYEDVRRMPRDLDQHFPIMRELAANCNHITLFGKRREADLAFAMGLVDRVRAGNPTPRLVSHNIEHDTLLLELDAFLLGRPEVRATTAPLVDYTRDNLNSIEVSALAEPTDALWLDTIHHADRVTGELNRYGGSVSRYIFLRGTGAYGIEAEGGGPGIFTAAREWCAQHPEWFVCYHTGNQYGLTVLSCNPEDKPPNPVIPWPPGFGVGTELQKMLKSIGITQLPGCDCLGKMNEMDIMGTQWCRDNTDALAGHLRDNAPRWGWQGYLTAAVWSMFTGMVFRINPTDPFPSLVKEAIRRAEAEAVLREKNKKQI